MKKAYFIFKITIIFLVMFLFLHIDLSAQSFDKAVLLDAWAQQDTILKSDTYEKAISFQMVRPAVDFDPEQGFKAMNCVMTKKNGAIVMKITYDYEKDLPVYIPPESNLYYKNEYDQEGKLIVWRDEEKYIYSDRNVNKVVKIIKHYYAYPDGKKVDVGNDHVMVYLYPVSHPDSTFELNLFNLAIGRGLKGLTMNSAEKLSTGQITIKNANAENGGYWDLIVDPNADYLVREGAFRVEGRTEPIQEIYNMGLVTRNGLKYAASGVLKVQNSQVAVEIDDKQPKTDDIYNEVLNYMKKPLDSQKTSIIDNRGEKPVMRKPTEEELQSP